MRAQGAVRAACWFAVMLRCPGLALRLAVGHHGCAASRATAAGLRVMHLPRQRTLCAVVATGDETMDPVGVKQEGAPMSTPKPAFQRRRLTTTGGLRNLPIVTPAYELLSQAVRKSKCIKQDMEVCSLWFSSSVCSFQLVPEHQMQHKIMATC